MYSKIPKNRRWYIKIKTIFVFELIEMSVIMTHLTLTAMPPGPSPLYYMDSGGLVRLARLGSLASEKRVLVSGLESGLGDALVCAFPLP